MLQRLASLGAGLVLLSLVTSGCVTQQGDGVFGPANSLGGVENNSPALSLKASPARGPGPLDVEFSLSALDRDGGPLTWSLDFGDRTALAAGNELPARPRHAYEAPGAYVATFKVIGSSQPETFVSTISIVVLEGVVPGNTTAGNTTQGPEEPPEYSPPRRSGGGGGGGGSSDSETETSTGNETTSETGTSTDPPSNGTSSTSESSTSTTDEPTSSETSSSSETGSDSGTSSSTDTETFADPDPTSSSSSSSDTSTSSDPDPTGSESQSSTDPPL